MNKLVQKISGLKTFLDEVKVELLKCSWPSRQELLGSAVLVIVSVVLLGIFVGACDLVNMQLLKIIIR